MLELAAPATAQSTDEWLDAEGRREASRRKAIDLLLLREKTSGDVQILRRMIKRLRKGRSPEMEVEDADVRAAVAAFEREAESAAEKRRAAEIAFSSQLREARAALRAAARNPRLREALAWQNRRALELAVDKLLSREPDADDSKTRQHERLLTRYLQRYCTKNETIGFFGPVSFGTIGGEDPLSIRHGPRFLSERRLYFEYRAIDALADRLAAEQLLRPFLMPRRRPDIRLEGERLHYSIEQTADLDPELAEVLERCTGDRTAASIGDLDSLEELEAGGLIFWSIELPTAGTPPEHELRRILERVEPKELRAAITEPLDRLEAEKRKVAAAAGDAAAVSIAMAGLERTHAELTGSALARDLVYEDCVRDVEVSISPEMLERIRIPLSLVLHSARWFTHRVAESYRRAFDEIYDRLGAGSIDFLRFWSKARALFEREPATSAALDELQQRWGRILNLDGPSMGRPAPRGPRHPGGPARIERSSSELEAAVRESFDAPHPGWPSARHHSPDLLIARQTDRTLVVLGELHVGLNTLTNPFMLDLHPRALQLLERRERELPVPGIAPVWSKARTRADFHSPSRHDLDLENGATKSSRPRHQVVQVGSLIIERIERVGGGGARPDKKDDSRLVVRTRDDRRAFDVIRFVEQHLIAEAHGSFSILPRAPHQPRVTIDELVIARESWRLSRTDLEPAIRSSGFDRFAAIRQVARRLGMPRYLFVGIAGQAKPIYLDLASPTLVDAFVFLMGEASDVVVAEMLPDPTQLWLEDRDGRYTSELRMAAVDRHEFAD